MYQNIRTNHNIDYFYYSMFIESFLEKQLIKNVSIKRDGKYVIRFVSIFHFDVYEQAEAFSSIFNLQKFLSSITALNYLRTVLTVISMLGKN